MSDKTMKPVWRQNIGEGVPSDFNPPSKILSRRQDGICIIINAHTPAKTWAWDSFYLNSPTIAAYQTTRTKEAKCKHIDCIECTGNRFKGLVYCGGYFEYRKCPSCNGKGYTRKLIK